jgi:dihydroneopterin aldolase
MVTLFVTGLEFYAHHGVPSEERAIGHRYILDLELDVDSRAEITDDVADTVDYAAVAQVALDIATGNQFKTVERLAHVIAEALLSKFSKLDRVNVRLAKRLPPAPIIAEELGVEIEMGRNRN